MQEAFKLYKNKTKSFDRGNVVDCTDKDNDKVITRAENWRVTWRINLVLDNQSKAERKSDSKNWIDFFRELGMLQVQRETWTDSHQKSLHTTRTTLLDQKAIERLHKTSKPQQSSPDSFQRECYKWLLERNKQRIRWAAAAIVKEVNEMDDIGISLWLDEQDLWWQLQERIPTWTASTHIDNSWCPWIQRLQIRSSDNQFLPHRVNLVSAYRSLGILPWLAFIFFVFRSICDFPYWRKWTRKRNDSNSTRLRRHSGDVRRKSSLLPRSSARLQMRSSHMEWKWRCNSMQRSRDERSQRMSQE